jgi:hypothetical protein
MLVGGDDAARIDDEARSDEAREHRRLVATGGCCLRSEGDN